MNKYEEILDQLNTLTAQVKDMMHQECAVTEEVDGCSEIYESLGNYHTLKAGKGYHTGVGNLCVVEDTGNGYIACFPSYASSEQEYYVCLDYAEADYLYKILDFIGRNNENR